MINGETTTHYSRQISKFKEQNQVDTKDQKITCLAIKVFLIKFHFLCLDFERILKWDQRVADTQS